MADQPGTLLPCAPPSVVRRRSLLTALGGVLLLSALTAASASSQAADTSTGQWTSVDLGPRIDFGVGSVGTHVLIAGGYTSDGSGNFTYFDRVDMYDSTTAAWSAASLSEPRSDPVLVSVGPQVLIAGGQTVVRAASQTVDIYDSVGDSWTTASLPTLSGSYLHSATSGTRAFFMDPPSTDIDVYDSATGGWSTIKPPRLRVIRGSASVGSQVLVWGENRNPQSSAPLVDSNDVDVYDSAAGQWIAQSAAKVDRDSSAVTVGSQVLFDSGVAPDQVTIYDAAAGTWSTAKLSQPRDGPSIAVLGSRVLLVGGLLNRSVASDAVDIYESATGRWTSTRLSQPRSGAAIVSVGSRLIIAGGRNGTAHEDATGDTFASSVDVYDGETARWTTARLSVRRDQVAPAAVGTLALFAGGFAPPLLDRHQHRLVNAVDVYEATSGTWSTASLSRARESAQVVVVGTQVLFIGGMAGCSGCGGSPLPPVVDIYDSVGGH